MQAVTEHFAGSGFKVFARMIEADPKTEVWAIPAKTGGSRAFCDRMNSWAQGQPVSRVSATSSGAPRTARSKAPARSPRTSVRSAPRRSASSSASMPAMPPSSSPAIPPKFYKFAGEARNRAAAST